jgi:hypothetical protein
MQGIGDGGARYRWEFAWAEEVFEALRPVIANYHLSEVRGDSEVAP